MTDDAPPPAADDPFPNDTLTAALVRHNVPLGDDVIGLLDRYCQTLWRYNESINLTRHTTYEKFVTRDVVDSLAFQPFLGHGERAIDVGTGNGVPGVILKIVRPDLDMTLTETIAKKAKVVGEIVAEIGLAARVHHGRAEELLKTQRADLLVLRAVAPLAKLATWFAPVQDRFERMLVIKGPGWVEERHEARQKRLLQKWELRKLAEWPLPGTFNNSVLLDLRRKTN